MNIVAYCQYPEGYNEEFRSRLAAIAPEANVFWVDDQHSRDEALLAALEKAEVILGYFPPNRLQYCKNLKLIIFDICGMDAYLSSPDLAPEVVLTNASGCYGNMMAEHALGLAMSICRTIPDYARKMPTGTWGPWLADKALEDSRVLILGAGDIGTSLARFLRPLVGPGGSITGTRRVKRAVPPEFDAMITLDELEEALPGADFVFCALPSTPATRGLLDARRLRLMKDDAVLINVGRGSLIPLDDLMTVLNEGKFYGVGLDVMEKEPLPAEHPLWRQPRVLLTPHSGGNCMAQDSPTGRRIAEVMLQNLENYIAGKPLLHVVDRETGYRKL